MTEQPLAVSVQEAVALGFYIRAGELSRLRRFRIKIIDAILQLEDGVVSPFSILINEEECWLLDEIITETSKDLAGASLRPLLRRVWTLLASWHEEERLLPPELPTSNEGDLRYQPPTEERNERIPN